MLNLHKNSRIFYVMANTLMRFQFMPFRILSYPLIWDWLSPSWPSIRAAWRPSSTSCLEAQWGSVMPKMVDGLIADPLLPITPSVPSSPPFNHNSYVYCRSSVSQSLSLVTTLLIVLATSLNSATFLSSDCLAIEVGHMFLLASASWILIGLFNFWMLRSEHLFW